MKKTFIVLAIVTLIGSAAAYMYFSSNSKTASSSPTAEQNLASPDRTAEINGYVLSVQGNEITVANEQGVTEITDEERARRQKMSQEERQALKSQESANLTKTNVTLTIPVGITIVKGSGAANGTNLTAEMSELTKGIYVSIWKSNDSIEFVKLKGVAAQ